GGHVEPHCHLVGGFHISRFDREGVDRIGARSEWRLREWAHRETQRLVHRDLPEIAAVHIDELLHARVRWKPDEPRGNESLRAVFLDDLISREPLEVLT